MDIQVVVAIAVVLVIAYIFLPADPFSDIPGPSLRDYLPGGDAYTLYADPKASRPISFRLLNRFGPIFQLRLGPLRAIITAHPADIAQTLSDAEAFVRPPNVVAAMDAVLPQSIFTMPRDEHIAARRELRRSFNHSLLPRFHGAITGAVREIVDHLQHVVKKTTKTATENGSTAPKIPADYVDINALLTTVTSRVILNVAFGCSMSREHRTAFIDHVNILIEEALLEFTGFPFRQLLGRFGSRRRLYESRARLDAVSEHMIAARKAETSAQRSAREPDLLDSVLALEGHDIRRSVSQVSMFVVTGGHTLAATLAWALFHLCRNPDAIAKLRAEVDAIVTDAGGDDDYMLAREDVPRLSFTSSVLRETLRLSPPVAAFVRYTTRDITLRGTGVHIPRGTHLQSFCAGTHRNDALFDQVEEFLPDRWSDPKSSASLPAGVFAPFSAGQRSCVGQFLAEYEGPLIIAELVRRFDFRLACPPEQVVCTAGLIDMPRWSSQQDGKLDKGIPLNVRLR